MNDLTVKIQRINELTDEQFALMDEMYRRLPKGSLTDSWVAVAAATQFSKRWEQRQEMMNTMHDLAKDRNPSMTYAWSAIIESSQADLVKDVIGNHELTQDHYDVMTAVWSAVTDEQ